ncbi:MAG: glycosyltransferase [Myxococcota bacterium]
MRLLYVTQVRLDRGQGGGRHVAATVSGFRDAGHQVTVVAPGTHPPPGVEHLAPAATAPGLRMELQMASLVGRAVFTRVPAVAYVRLSASSSAVPATLAGLGVPFVVELNGPILDEMKARGRSDLRVAAVRESLKTVVRSSRALVAVLPSIAAHARKHLSAESVHVVENGADIRLATPGDRRAARIRMHLPENARLVGFAGSLSPEVQLDPLLEALRSKDLHLAVAGAGPGADKFYALSSDPAFSGRVHYRGEMAHEEALDLVRALDVYVNLRVGWTGMRPLEALVMGRRCAVIRADGVERLVRATRELPDFVHVAASPSASAVAEAIDSALRAEETYGPPSLEALEPIRTELSWERSVSRLLEILQWAT